MPADDVTSSDPSEGDDATGTARRAAVIMGGLTAAVLLGLILRGHDDHRASYDQNVYHLPTIRQFASELPRPNFSNYLSATTPGYHLILAVLSKAGGFTDRLIALKLAGALFTVGFICTIAYAIARRVGTRQSIVLTLPALCSLYVISSGVWLLPDNAAWWGVAGVMAVAMGGWRGRRTAVLGGAVLLATVLMRQSHLWCAVPLWAAAWIPSADEGHRHKMRRLLTMVVATAPAFAVTAYFVWLWGGPAPEKVRGLIHGGNPAAPAAVLSLIGVVSPFFAGYLLPALRGRLQSVQPLLVGAACGLLMGAGPATSYDMDAGRWSGLWNAVNHFPVIANRSSLIIPLSCAGGLALAAWFVALPRRVAWIFLVAWIAFIAAQVPNAMAFQRYYEPMVLISLALAAVHLPRDGRQQRPGLAWCGPVLLSLVLASITAFTLSKRDTESERPSDNTTPPRNAIGGA